MHPKCRPNNSKHPKHITNQWHALSKMNAQNTHTPNKQNQRAMRMKLCSQCKIDILQIEGSIVYK